MKINEANGYNVQADKYGKMQQAGTDKEMDSESKDFQNQIANAQNRLKELSANPEMTDEEKKQKRQEIQKKIAELNNQLRQHQIELRREQQAKKDQAEEVSDEKQNQLPGLAVDQEETQTAAASQSGMKAVISADTAIRQAKAQGNLARTMEGRVRVLQGEIKQDAGRGKNTESKQKELEALEKKAAQISGSQMGILSDAAREMKKAAEFDNQKDKNPGEEQKKVSEKMLNVAMGTSSRNKTDIYTRGKTFSTVNIHI